MKRRRPLMYADGFHRDIIRSFECVEAGLSRARVISTTTVLKESTSALLVPARFIIITKNDHAFHTAKRVLGELGFRREHPSCRHYLLGTIISVKIERPSECETYKNYRRTGEWIEI